jgi:hypothetical protein
MRNANKGRDFTAPLLHAFHYQIIYWTMQEELILYPGARVFYWIWAGISIFLNRLRLAR